MRHWAIRTLPNVASALNLFCGASAIAALFLGRDDLVVAFLLLCFFLDVLDGFLARTLKAQSLFGKEMDSLADLVSFGLLPACMVFRWLFVECRATEHLPVALLAFMLAVGAAVRLAKFNLDLRQSRIFLGLPTPAMTVFIGGIFFMEFSGHAWVVYFLCEPAFFVSLIVILPLLMVSDLKLWSLKALAQPNGGKIFGGFLLLFAILLVVVHSAAIPLMVIAYLVLGLANLLFKFYGDEIQS